MNDVVRAISWNVAGLRAAVKKEALVWLAAEDYDFILLQEVKAREDQLSNEILSFNNYRQIYHPAERKGYSGVSIWIHPRYSGDNIKITKGLGVEEFDREGRFLQIEWNNFIFINSYFPNGSRDHSRVPFKMNYCRAFLNHIEKLDKKNKMIFLGGDFNTAHHEIDLANPKTNKKTTGFLPIEREWLDELEQADWIDLYRQKNPNQSDVYSWWTYRGDCRARNIGWRIDYFWGNKRAYDHLREFKYRTEVLGSDHCPVEITVVTKKI